MGFPSLFENSLERLARELDQLEAGRDEYLTSDSQRGERRGNWASAARGLYDDISRIGRMLSDPRADPAAQLVEAMRELEDLRPVAARVAPLEALLAEESHKRSLAEDRLTRTTSDLRNLRDQVSALGVERDALHKQLRATTTERDDARQKRLVLEERLEREREAIVRLVPVSQGSTPPVNLEQGVARVNGYIQQLLAGAHVAEERLRSARQKVDELSDELDRCRRRFDTAFRNNPTIAYDAYPPPRSGKPDGR